MLSSDSPGTLSLSAKITKFSSDSPGSHCQSHQTSHTTKNTNLTCNATRSFSPIFLTLTTTVRNSIAYIYHISNTTLGSKVFQPCSAPWYLPKICSRISQACLCISASKSLRWSRNIAMMSRWFALRRTSSSNGKSHSKRTIRVCTSLKTLVTLSKPIIQPMSWSSTASRNGRVLVRLSILSTDRMATLSLSLNASVPTRIQWFLKFYFQGFPGSCRSSYGPNTSLVSPGPTPNFSLPILPISLCLSPGKLSELFTVQAPHLCLQDPLPTSAYRDTLDAHLQASCRSSHCPNTSLVSPGLTPNFSLSRYSKHFKKHVVSGNQLTSHLQQMTLQPTCQKKVKQNTRHLNQEYSNSSMPFDFTSAMYQPSDHFRTLVQAQHRSRENLGAQYK